MFQYPEEPDWQVLKDWWSDWGWVVRTGALALFLAGGIVWVGEKAVEAHEQWVASFTVQQKDHIQSTWKTMLNAPEWTILKMHPQKHRADYILGSYQDGGRSVVFCGWSSNFDIKKGDNYQFLLDVVGIVTPDLPQYEAVVMSCFKNHKVRPFEYNK
jgi:hypothetical protein